MPAPHVIPLLRRSRLSRTKLLLRHIFLSTPELRRAAQLLCAAHDLDPSAVDTVLSSPWIAVWAALCVREPTVRSHREAANGVALAAAARAGLHDRGLLVSPQHGYVTIPGIGRLACGDRKRLSPQHLGGQGWEPVRSISARHHAYEITLSVEDLDPYRDCHDAPAAERLADSEVAALQLTFERAWRMLVEVAPLRAAELANGMVSLVPMTGGTSRSSRSATNMLAFGGFGTTVRDDPLELAVTMVHEFQHSKLSALTSLIPLYGHDLRNRYFAPWRTEPRPLSGLLHGIFAFTAVAALWSDLRSDPGLREQATKVFTATRAEVWRACESLADSTELTEAGRWFAEHLFATVEQLMSLPVPATANQRAKRRLARIEAQWRDRIQSDERWL